MNVKLIERSTVKSAVIKTNRRGGYTFNLGKRSLSNTE